MIDHDSLPEGIPAQIATLDERQKRQRREIDVLSSDLYGNGKEGIKPMTQRHDEWIRRQDDSERERRNDARDLRRVLIGGLILQLAAVCGGLLWIGFRVAVAGGH